MSKSKVMMSQAEEVRQLAISKGVTRAIFEKALKDGSFTNFFRELLPPRLRFPTWVTARVGGQKNPRELRDLLLRQSLRFEWDDYAAEMLDCIFPADIFEEKVEFVRASNRELGFLSRATIEESQDAGRRFGLIQCKPWDTPHVRLAYLDQPEGESICMMMEPICFDRFSHVFGLSSWPPVLCVDRVGCVKLNSFDADHSWIFRRQKNS